jgi:hypothetical protein
MSDKEEEQKRKKHEWYIKNRERVIENQKAYRKYKISTDYNFRMKVVDYQARYFQKNKDKRKQEMINNYQNNRQKEQYINKTINISKDDVTVIF